MSEAEQIIEALFSNPDLVEAFRTGFFLQAGVEVVALMVRLVRRRGRL